MEDYLDQIMDFIYQAMDGMDDDEKMVLIEAINEKLDSLPCR